MADVVTAHGCVDGLINNAGIIQPFEPVAQLSDQAMHRVLDVNLMGTINMTRAFLPVLIDRSEAHLANVSSMGGFFPSQVRPSTVRARPQSSCSPRACTPNCLTAR